MQSQQAVISASSISSFGAGNVGDVPGATSHSSKLFGQLPHGLANGTVVDYNAEWVRYLTFTKNRCGVNLPGRDTPGDMQLLWQYLQHRTLTCKPSTINSITVKLAHFGSMCGYVFLNSKFDNNVLLYKKLARMKKQLALDVRARAASVGQKFVQVDRCTPTGPREHRIAVVSLPRRVHSKLQRIAAGRQTPFGKFCNAVYWRNAFWSFR